MDGAEEEGEDEIKDPEDVVPFGSRQQVHRDDCNCVCTCTVRVVYPYTGIIVLMHVSVVYSKNVEKLTYGTLLYICFTLSPSLSHMCYVQCTFSLTFYPSLSPSLPLSLSPPLPLRGSQTPNTTLLPAPPTTKSTTPHSLRPEWALRGLRLVRPHFASGETEETKRYQVQLKQHVLYVHTHTVC